MPNLEGLDSPFEGYTGEKNGRGESTAEVAILTNDQVPKATATPSRGAQVNVFAVKHGPGHKHLSTHPGSKHNPSEVT